MIHIDTHIAVWTHLGQSRRLTTKAKQALERGPIRYSPMLRLELNILHERQRLPASSPEAVLADLVRDFDAEEYDGSIAAIVDIAERLAWTGDPFDRLIVASATADGARLVTADTDIIDNFAGAVW